MIAVAIKYLSIIQRKIKLKKRIMGYFAYKKDYNEYNKKNTNPKFKLLKKYDYPILTERYGTAGYINSYFWQDLWAARHIYKDNPKIHYDIGSKINGFIAHLASFREDIVLLDIRPLPFSISGVRFKQEDATLLEGIPDNSIESISALCSLEHFGLGRYGDSIDPEGYLKAMKSIVRVVKVGGHAYISVPIGMEHIEFNAHRVFFPATIIEIFKPMKLVEFSTTIGDLIIYDDDFHKYDKEDNAKGARFGLFHFVK